MEMMRHPGETTNMRRQTVASYFRVRLLILGVVVVLLLLFLFSFAFILLKEMLANTTLSNFLLRKILNVRIIHIQHF